MLSKIINTTSLKVNIAANFVGNAWSALISILFVPLYLNYIGAEGYGLIGIFASLQVVLSLLDTGLSTTLNKELARLNVLPGMEQKMRNLVKTLGSIYWIIAMLAGLIAIALSPLIARYWVKPIELTIQTVTNAFILLGIAIIFQFPTGFYSGGLLGLQRQVILNILRIFFATLRSVGALVVLIFISDSILTFFGWTLLVSILQAFAFKFFLWRYLPKTTAKAVFDKDELKSIWRFAAGMTAIGITGVLLMQVDKIVLSKILTLDQFGYYTLAFTIGSVIYMIVSPVSQSYFPKFSALVAQKNTAELKRIYHQSCQLVTLLVLPFALFTAFFSKEILLLWTQNEVTVNNTSLITSIVAVAIAMHCLMFMPYMLSLSNNNTKLALYTNIIILVILIPGTIFSSLYFGGVGGAVCWLCVTSIYLIVNPVLVHNLFLKGETFNWYWNDTFKPVIGCLIILTAARLLIWNHKFAQPEIIGLLIVSGSLAFVSTLLSTTALRNHLIYRVRSNKK